MLPAVIVGLSHKPKSRPKRGTKSQDKVISTG